MATTAAIVAGAAVASAAASTANSAYQAHKTATAAGAKPPTMKGLTKAQQNFNRQTQSILDQEQAMLANAGSQGAAVSEEVYRKLGYEPQYDSPKPDYAVLKADQDQAHSDAVSAYLAWQKAPKGSKAKREANAALSKARDVALAKTTAYHDALSNPRNVIGLNKIPSPNGAPAGHDPSNPDDLMQVALDLQNQTLIRALQGKEPIDSTLTHSFEVGENNLRAKLQRQLGPDYETSTAGSEAISAFERTKGEAYESFNRSTVELFSKLTESRATTLANLTTNEINNLLTPTKTMLSIANSLGQSADDRNKYIGMQMDWRSKQAGAAINAYGAGTQRMAVGLDANDQTNKYIQQLAGIGTDVATSMKSNSLASPGYAGNPNAGSNGPGADTVSSDTGGFSGDSNGAGYSGVSNPYAV